ncbi:MAG: hypothetical protein IPN42_10745 [Methylococcaceae bacterium]|nr:hypothetical protein [Methylococcaceae bacterium]
MCEILNLGDYVRTVRFSLQAFIYGTVVNSVSPLPAMEAHHLCHEDRHSIVHLTYANMEAGFTDSAHFNRCFRKTFRVNPLMLFRNIDRFEI